MVGEITLGGSSLVESTGATEGFNLPPGWVAGFNNELARAEAKTTGLDTAPIRYARNMGGSTMTDAPEVLKNPKTPGSSKAAGLKRLGGLLGLGIAGWETGKDLHKMWFGREGLAAKKIGQLLGGQVSAWSKQGYVIGSHLGLGGVIGPQAHIDYANGMLSLKSGNPVDFRKMDPNALADLIEAPWPDAATLQKHSDQLKAQGKADGEAKAEAEARTDAASNMPEIVRPADPGGGKCACKCRAGDATDPSTYRFATWTAPTCQQAAKTACKIASERAGVANQHHSQAQCSDGSNRNAGGGLAR